MVNWKKLQEEIKLSQIRLLISGDKEFKPDNYYVINTKDSVVSLTGYDIVSLILSQYIDRYKSKFDKLTIITGDNSGSDLSTINYCEANNIEYKSIRADWDNNGNRAGYIKNETMVMKTSISNTGKVVLFWNGNNPYTSNLIYLAKSYGLSIDVYNYVEKVWLSKDDIKEIYLVEEDKRLSYKKV